MKWEQSLTGRYTILFVMAVSLLLLAPFDFITYSIYIVYGFYLTCLNYVLECMLVLFAPGYGSLIVAWVRYNGWTNWLLPLKPIHDFDGKLQYPKPSFKLLSTFICSSFLSLSPNTFYPFFIFLTAVHFFLTDHSSSSSSLSGVNSIIGNNINDSRMYRSYPTKNID